MSDQSWANKLKNDDPMAALAAMSGVNDRKQADPDQLATVLTLDKIRIDGGTQPRAKLDQAMIDSYAEDMQRGDKFPPVIVFYDGTNYWLADGFHRFYAARKAGVTALSAEVRQGRQREAILYSVGVNATHGLRRTNADKHRAVMTLLEDKEWVAWSDREIARQCKVSQPIVSSLRRDLSDNETQIADDSKRMVRRGDTVYEQDVSNVQATNVLRAAREALVKLDLPPLDEAMQAEVSRTLRSSVDYVKSEYEIGGAYEGGYRRYLPYALALEMDEPPFSEPRLSLVKWLRAELPKWKKEREAEQRQEAAPQLGEPTREGADPIVAACQQIVALLTTYGPMSPIELRGELREVSSVVYEVARDTLVRDGTLVRDQAVRTGHVIYRLADQQADALAPEQTSSTATSPATLSPYGQFAHLGVDAHSRDHDPEQASAYKLRLQLEQATMDATDALERLLQIRGIRSLHVLSSQEMAETDDLLRRLLEYVWDDAAGDNPAAYHIRTLREKLAIMDETGQPYDPAVDEEGGQ